ncbi:MAG: hypothetical protein HY909_25510 [Deltaproteobacteria bacterium]|nr:hypothetical protein [Deltaproteobacteria bacterium]
MWRVGCVCLVLSAGCARPSPQAPRSPSARSVVLPSGVALYATASDQDPVAHTTSEVPSAWRSVGRQGDRVRVESVEPSRSGRHCAALDPGLAGLRLRLWAREGDLLPVVSRALTVDLGEGRSLTLSAGMPAREHAPGRARVGAGPVTVWVPVGEGGLASSYAAVEVLAAPDGSERVGGRDPLDLGAAGRLQGDGVHSLGLGIARRRPSRGGALAVVGARCLRAEVEVPTARIDPVLELSFGGDDAPAAEGPGFPAGAALTLADGRVVGRVAGRRGGPSRRVCARLSTARVTPLELCARAVE